ncbi:hypothetical protein PR048_023106 [Dryococelus australis]|uniref:Uncharacterized protein n=1 Tax=Dryococelus australis TaxID=614101 RepID=A0ABQ9GT78_9NEOP|nr:hypothetical protein PR048_023106 [Dryococelus australis]
MLPHHPASSRALHGDDEGCGAIISSAPEDDARPLTTLRRGWARHGLHNAVSTHHPQRQSPHCGRDNASGLRPFSAAISPLHQARPSRTPPVTEAALGRVVRLLAIYPPGRIGFDSRRGRTRDFRMWDDATGRRVFSGISRFPRPCIPAMIHTHLASPSSAHKTLDVQSRPNLFTKFTHSDMLSIGRVYTGSELVPIAVTSCPNEFPSRPVISLTLAQSSPSTVTEDNQCAVDIGICLRKTLESNLQVVELANFSAAGQMRKLLQQPLEVRQQLRRMYGIEFCCVLLFYPRKINGPSYLTLTGEWRPDMLQTRGDGVRGLECKRLAYKLASHTTQVDLGKKGVHLPMQESELCVTGLTILFANDVRGSTTQSFTRCQRSCSHRLLPLAEQLASLFGSAKGGHSVVPGPTAGFSISRGFEHEFQRRY